MQLCVASTHPLASESGEWAGVPASPPTHTKMCSCNQRTQHIVRSPMCLIRVWGAHPGQLRANLVLQHR